MATSNVAVIEGSRCAGKDTLIKRILAEVWSNPFQRPCVYESLAPRKAYTDASGSAKPPADLEAQQSSLWVLDFLRQTKLRALLNRGLLSSFAFDAYSEERLQLFQAWLREAKGVVIMCLPSEEALRSNLAKENRAHELFSVLQERVRMAEYGHRMHKDLVGWYVGD